MKWKPNKKEKEEFKRKMEEIDIFCRENNIAQSLAGDSYYFQIDGKNYRVSNHTIEASNKAAYNDWGEQIRPLYHKEDDEEIQIIAGKTRIIEIYNDLKNGIALDRRGKRKGKERRRWS